MKVQEPDKGLVIAWGLDIDGEGPDITAAWAPGHKRAAYTLAMLIHDNRERLQEAGVDLTTLKITANDD
jgi:hypothetical protein